MEIRLMRSIEVLKKIRETFPSYHEQGFYTHVKKGNLIPFAKMYWRPGKTANLFTQESVDEFILKLKARKGL